MAVLYVKETSFLAAILNEVGFVVNLWYVLQRFENVS